jgi:hypothetical protein
MKIYITGLGRNGLNQRSLKTKEKYLMIDPEHLMMEERQQTKRNNKTHRITLKRGILTRA